MPKSQITNSAKETQELAAEFAGQILRQNLGKTAVVLALQGDLGAGKTTFLQGFARGFGIKEKILSPTFILMKKFKIPTAPSLRTHTMGTRRSNLKSKTQKSSILKNSRSLNLEYKNFYHFDCYRLSSEKDLEALDFKKIISNPKNIVAIEWPEKIKNILPENIISINCNHLEESKRELTINY